MFAVKNIFIRNDDNKDNHEELILRIFNKLFKETFDTDYPFEKFR